MRKICDYLGCEIFKIGEVYYAMGRINHKTTNLNELIKIIER